ncbi:hypothetical protein Y032_0125g1283 [Ancylostoma ceylanicum]|uniref:Uncharacterized protein n=1 Tax=Ancylostoma ceylanicum TaxID=53326 RepID=A0A016T8V0_9BILA|nr:hypothetical protein Y032_0125g1283 [Ancylostoma ceylanicum]
MVVDCPLTDGHEIVTIRDQRKYCIRPEVGKDYRGSGPHASLRQLEHDHGDISEMCGCADSQSGNRYIRCTKLLLVNDLPAHCSSPAWIGSAIKPHELLRFSAFFVLDHSSTNWN